MLIFLPVRIGCFLVSTMNQVGQYQIVFLQPFGIFKMTLKPPSNVIIDIKYELVVIIVVVVT